MADQLSPQWPADRTCAGVGPEQFAEPVLLLLGFLQVSPQLDQQMLVAGHVADNGQVAIRAHCSGEPGQGVCQPTARLRIVHGAVVTPQPDDVRKRPAEHPHGNHHVLQGLQPLAQPDRGARQRGRLRGLSRTLSSALRSSSSTRAISPTSERARSTH